MSYRRKDGKKPLRRLALIFLLVGGVLYLLWAGDFLNLFSPSTRVKDGSNKNKLVPEKRLRHEIYDRNMDILALSLRMYSVYAHPLELKKGERTIAQLIKILGIDGSRLRRQLRTKRNFIWLKRHISSEKAKKIAALGFGGIYLAGERQRLYPHGKIASQVIGFVKEEQGLAGTEFIYDNLLRGDWPPEPVNLGETSIDYRKITENGASVVLTLDLKLQARVEQRLAALIKKTGAQSGMAVLMNAVNGEILVNANLPAYDPNRYWNYSSFNRRNRVDADPVYLGGLAKFLRLAAAIRQGKISVPALKPKQDAMVINPRKIKRLLGGGFQVSKGVWQKVNDGVYRLPYINESDVTLDNDGLEKFVAQLGLGKSSEDNSTSNQSTQEPFTLKPLDQITLLDLAAAFSRTINGGKILTPHLLHGVWTGPEKGEVESNFVSTARTLFSHDEFLTFLRQHFQAGGEKPLVLESMVAVQEKVSDDIEFTGADLLPLGKESGGDKKNTEKEVAAKPAVVAVKRFEALGIGMYSKGSGSLVLAMALDGVSRGYAAKPIFTKVIRRILRSNNVPKSKRSKGGGAKGDMVQGFNRQWRKMHLTTKTSDITTGNDEPTEFMPKLQGNSLRKSLQMLSGLGLRIQIDGAGQVAGQSPKAGMVLKSGQNCRLKLRYKVMDEIEDGATTH
jgi:hypothetical protein